MMSLEGIACLHFPVELRKGVCSESELHLLFLFESMLSVVVEQKDM